MTLFMCALECAFIYVAIAMPIHFYDIIVDELADGIQYTTGDYVAYGLCASLWVCVIVDVLAMPVVIKNIYKD